MQWLWEQPPQTVSVHQLFEAQAVYKSIATVRSAILDTGRSSLGDGDMVTLRPDTHGTCITPRCTRITDRGTRCVVCRHKEEVEPRLRALVCSMYSVPALRVAVLKSPSREFLRNFIADCLFDGPAQRYPYVHQAGYTRYIPFDM